MPCQWYWLPGHALSGRWQCRQLANQFFKSGSYQKASELYLGLYNTHKSPNYYQGLLDCYIALSEIDAAEKLVKTHSKKYDENQDSPKVEINTHMGETNRKAVSIYVLILNTGNSKALLKLLILINKIPTALCYDQEYPFQRVPLFFWEETPRKR